VLKKMLLSMGLGILPKERVQARRDEIGEMGNALNDLIRSMQHTTDFAKETGAGNFDATYTPLSKDDSLGLALIKMRDDLAENERILKQKVIERTEEVVRQKSEIETKNEELEILYKQVTDSIHYAKRIQDTILPTNTFVREALKDSFILYLPKDIVSGDFYWIVEHNDKVFCSAIDCTGHGVPGAFMSIMGYNNLNYAINVAKANKPSEILNALNKAVTTAFSQKKSDSSSVRDGMDVALCMIDFKAMKLDFAGANNPIYIIRNKEIITLNPDKFPIGNYMDDRDQSQSFSNKEFNLQQGDCIYLFTDGYKDQFGGDQNKKFLVKRFKQLLSEISAKPMPEQGKILDETIMDWMGHRSAQVDDILVIGIKV